MKNHLIYLISILTLNACIIETNDDVKKEEQNNPEMSTEKMVVKLLDKLPAQYISLSTENKIASIKISFDTIPFDDFKMGFPASYAALTLYEELQTQENIDSIHVKVSISSIPDSATIRYSIEDLNSCQNYLVKLDEFTELYNNENWLGIKEFFNFNEDTEYVDELIENYIKEQRQLFGEFDGGQIDGCFFTKEIVGLYLNANNLQGYSCYVVLLLDKKTASPIELAFNDLSLIR